GLFILLGALIPTLLGSVVSNVAMAAGSIVQPDPYWSGVLTWGLGDAMGILLLTPLVTHWRQWPFANLQSHIAWVTVMLMTLVLGLTIMLYVDAPSGLFYLLLAMAVLAAVTSGMAGATSVAALLALCVLGLGMSQVSG